MTCAVYEDSAEYCVRNEMMCISDFFTRLKMYIVTKIYTEYERGAAPEVPPKRENNLFYDAVHRE